MGVDFCFNVVDKKGGLIDGAPWSSCPDQWLWPIFDPDPRYLSWAKCWIGKMEQLLGHRPNFHFFEKKSEEPILKPVEVIPQLEGIRDLLQVNNSILPTFYWIARKGSTAASSGEFVFWERKYVHVHGDWNVCHICETRTSGPPDYACIVHRNITGEKEVHCKKAYHPPVPGDSIEVEFTRAKVIYNAERKELDYWQCLKVPSRDGKSFSFASGQEVFLDNRLVLLEVVGDKLYAVNPDNRKEIFKDLSDSRKIQCVRKELGSPIEADSIVLEPRPESAYDFYKKFLEEMLGVCYWARDNGHLVQSRISH